MFASVFFCPKTGIVQAIIGLGSNRQVMEDQLGDLTPPAGLYAAVIAFVDAISQHRLAIEQHEVAQFMGWDFV